MWQSSITSVSMSCKTSPQKAIKFTGQHLYDRNFSLKSKLNMPEVVHLRGQPIRHQEQYMPNHFRSTSATLCEISLKKVDFDLLFFSGSKAKLKTEINNASECQNLQVPSQDHILYMCLLLAYIKVNAHIINLDPQDKIQVLLCFSCKEIDRNIIQIPNKSEETSYLKFFQLAVDKRI